MVPAWQVFTCNLSIISKFILVTQGKQWNSDTSSSADPFWSKYHKGVRPSGLLSNSTSVYIDPHILSTPIITDFDGDGSEEELVIVTNFYFEEKRWIYQAKFRYLLGFIIFSMWSDFAAPAMLCYYTLHAGCSCSATWSWNIFVLIINFLNHKNHKYHWGTKPWSFSNLTWFSFGELNLVFFSKIVFF